MGRGFREHAGGKASAPGDSAWSIWAEIQRRSSTPFLLPNPAQPPLRASVSHSPCQRGARSSGTVLPAMSCLRQAFRWCRPREGPGFQTDRPFRGASDSAQATQLSKG